MEDITRRHTITYLEEVLVRKKNNKKKKKKKEKKNKKKKKEEEEEEKEEEEEEEENKTKKMIHKLNLNMIRHCCFTGAWAFTTEPSLLFQ
ncbi:hypothetical protein DPMN_147636 [Dreissena polymorpha]|uniref:Uncharacterized protein n=1 Tax=Dreissena polymorpha TaxID=45954 RepID=A0A9D4J0T1_DREPO|nr:hypothetical protein DPMN_147636 [Dreissena polymorpha]